MIDMGVNTSIGNQPDEVQWFILGFTIFECAKQFGVGIDGFFADGFVDEGQLLINHTACADVQMSHLGITHLAFGQTHILARGAQPSMWPRFIKPIHIWRVGGANRIGG